MKYPVESKLYMMMAGLEVPAKQENPALQCVC